MKHLEHQEAGLRLLWWSAMIEASTLIILLFVAVPLKHLMGIPLAVSIMGPLHGMVFMVHIWITLNIATQNSLRKKQIIKIIGAACLPFGGFFTAKSLNLKAGSISL